MKFKMILVSIFLLAIFTLGAVSAADDIVADNLTADDSNNIEIQADIDESNGDIIESAENEETISEKDDSGMYLIHDGEYIEDELDTEDACEYLLTVEFPQEVTGNLSIFVDNIHITDDEISDESNYYDIELKNNNLLTYGTHEIEVRYSGDDTYLSKTIKENFNVTYSFSASFDNNAYYSTEISVQLPYNALKNLNYTINGKKYSKKPSRDILIKTDLELGTNTIVLSYEDKNYPLKTITETINVESKIVGPYESVKYGENAEYLLILPKDAKGNLHIYKEQYNEETEDYEKITIKKVPVKDGKAVCTISDLELGQNEYYAEYDGSDYEVETNYDGIHVIPNLIYPKNIWTNSTGNSIIVHVPNETTITSKVDIKYYDWDNEDQITVNLYTGTHKGDLSIPLPKLDAHSYDIEATIGDYNLFDMINVLFESPDTGITAKFSEYQSGFYGFSFEELIIPENADGKLVLIIDGKINGEASATASFLRTTIGDIVPLSPGTHDVELKLVNDSYYKDSSVKGKIEKTYFNMPNEESKSFKVSVSDDATGYACLSIDNEIYDIKFLNDGLTYFNIENITYGEHTYEIKYDGDDKYPSETRSGKFNYTYSLSAEIVGDEWIAYGNCELTIAVPPDATGYATVYVDGKNPQTVKNFSDSPGKLVGIYGLYKNPDLSVGKHKITVTYCDDKYPLKTVEVEFSIKEIYMINSPYSDGEYKRNDDYNTISLVLPENAKGNLVVNIDGVEKIIKLEKGKANYSLENLNCGYHTIFAYYDGNDYPVEKNYLHDEEEKYMVYPKITAEEFTVGGENKITVEVQKEAKGNMKVEIYDMNQPIDEYSFEYQLIKTTALNLKDGKGTMSFSDLPKGDYNIKFIYNGDDMDIPEAEKIVFNLVPNNITLDYPENIYTNEKADIIFKSPIDNNGNLTVIIDKKSASYSLKNGEIIIPIENLSEGPHEIHIDYFGDKTKDNRFSEDILIQKANPHITISQKSPNMFDIKMENDTHGKIILYADGKTYEQAVSNGQATVITEKLSGNHKVIVAYSGDEKYLSTSESLNITGKSAEINKTAKIIASDLSAIYKDGKKYSVTVYDSEGNIAQGVEVVFKINAKKIGSAKTNAKGVASIKITQTPKTYKITSEALRVNVTKKLTVKHILTLKKVTVKKSAKKLVLTATLKKVKGKILKNKKITFKFNGKTYKVKTNKKGIAKLTIKKSVLNKLKVGKKVTYQATYIKDTVKYTVKVKK